MGFWRALPGGLARVERAAFAIPQACACHALTSHPRPRRDTCESAESRRSSHCHCLSSSAPLSARLDFLGCLAGDCVGSFHGDTFTITPATAVSAFAAAAAATRVTSRLALAVCDGAAADGPGGRGGGRWRGRARPLPRPRPLLRQMPRDARLQRLGCVLRRGRVRRAVLAQVGGDATLCSDPRSRRGRAMDVRDAPF